MTSPSDLDLLRRFGADDPAERERAFALLFERHQRRAFDLAHRVLGDSSLASDAVQEAFLTVYRKGARFEARAQFTSWLYRVVLNQAIDLQRREKRHRAVMLGTSQRGDSDEPAAAPELAGPPEHGPSARAVSGERERMVRTAIEQLSPKLAAVVVLRYPRGLSYEEIGEILDLPPGTVKSRLNRAHAALRVILQDKFEEP